MDRCKNIVITGGNRGIGLEFVKQLLTYNPDHIFATYRDEISGKKLLELAKHNSNLHPVAIDVQDTENYANFVSEVEAVTNGAGVNLLINNSGYFNKQNNTALSQLDKDDLLYHFSVNTMAPILLTQAFLPLLEKASQKEKDAPVGVGRAVVVNMTSVLGSIAENGNGGAYGYRISKAALNQASKTMSVELLGKGVLVIPLHPGYVQTDMGGRNALISTEESVTDMISVLEGLSERSNGRFLWYDGREGRW